MDVGQCCNLYFAALRIGWSRAIFKGRSRKDFGFFLLLLISGVDKHTGPLHSLVWMNNRSKAHDHRGICLPSWGPASALCKPVSAEAMSNEALTQGWMSLSAGGDGPSGDCLRSILQDTLKCLIISNHKRLLLINELWRYTAQFRLKAWQLGQHKGCAQAPRHSCFMSLDDCSSAKQIRC